MSKSSIQHFVRKHAILIAFLLPVLSFLFIRTEYLARFVASLLFNIYSGILFLVSGFRIKYENASKLERLKIRPNPKKLIVVKTIIVAFALGWIYVITIPSMIDFCRFCQKGVGYLQTVRGRVVLNSSPAGMYFLVQSISIAVDQGAMQVELCGLFFPRHASLGKTYEFMYAPQSTLLLKFDSITSEAKAPLSSQ